MCSDATHVQSPFINGGFCNWKNAVERLHSHEQSKEHVDATIAFNRRFKVDGLLETNVAQQFEQHELTGSQY